VVERKTKKGKKVHVDILPKLKEYSVANAHESLPVLIHVGEWSQQQHGKYGLFKSTGECNDNRH